MKAQMYPRKCEMVDKKGGLWKEKHKRDPQLWIECLFSQSFGVKADRRGVRFIRVLLNERAPWEEKHVMEDGLA